RLKVSFWNNTPSEAPLHVRARRASLGSTASALPAELRRRLDERAHQTREIVYYLQQPETHAFDLYHDYTESRPGVGQYLNVVRKGSRAANPSARNLDTGETLAVETVKGDALPKIGTPEDEEVPPDSEVVVVHFAP